MLGDYLAKRPTTAFVNVSRAVKCIEQRMEEANRSAAVDEDEEDEESTHQFIDLSL